MKTIASLVCMCVFVGCEKVQKADFKAEYDISQTKEAALGAEEAKIPLHVLKDNATDLFWGDSHGALPLNEQVLEQMYQILKACKYQKIINAEKRLCIGSICSKNKRQEISFDFYFGGLLSCNDKWFYIGSDCVTQIVGVVNNTGVKQ